MAVFVRAKRVTDPLDDKVKACLCGDHYRKTGYVSSGSEHEPDSACLFDLIHGFLDDEDDGIRPPEDSEDYSSDPSHLESTEMLEDLLNPTVEDGFRHLLLSRVSKAVDTFTGFRSNKAGFRRMVMGNLRDSGYNAGICKTKWESAGGLTAGNYEFIDVVVSEGATSQRYFVDVEFSGEFEIARPTAEYDRLLQVLPRIFVGKADGLKQVIRLLSDAAKRSLKSKKLHFPPWRKNRYMLTKWFGSYKRTLVNQASFLPDYDQLTVKCRSVGFDAVKSTALIPAATRTR